MQGSIVNLLGGAVAGSAGGDANGKNILLTAGGEGRFAELMEKIDNSGMTPQQMLQFFMNPQAANQNQALDAAPSGQQAVQWLMQLQSELPQDVWQSIQQALVLQVGVEGGVELSSPLTDAELLAALPQRELTPEELSEIVQKTGLNAYQVLNALAHTPAASPQLAMALPDGMGDAELPAATMAGAAALEVRGRDGMMALPLDMDADGDLTPEQRAILEKIVAALPQNRHDVQTQQQATVKAVELPQVPRPAAENTTPVAANAATPGGTASAIQNQAQPQEQVQVRVTATRAAASDAAQQQVSGAGAGAGNPSSTAVTAEIRSADMPRADFRAELAQNTRHTTPMPVMDQVHVRIREALGEGANRIEIRLSPAELGRVEVRIETGADGHSRIHVLADSKDTLEILQRDARGLERALNDAGLKTDSGSLSFNLRGDQNQQQAKNGAGADQQGQGAGDSELLADEELDERLHDSEMAVTYGPGLNYRVAVQTGLDISV